MHNPINVHHGANELGDVLSRLSSHHVEVAVEHGIVVAKLHGIDAYVAANTLKGKLK